jgi:voltage-gated potassium channel
VEPISFRRFLWAQIAFTVMLVIGAVGFHSVTNEDWVESAYRAVVTTTLTGIDSRPPGEGAQIFTIVLLLGGVAIFLYLAGTIVELIARGIVTGAWSERRRRQVIEKLRDHYIICGYGRVGRRIAEQFRAAGEQYVVLDFNAEMLERAVERGDLYVEGTGTSDDDLRAAGIEHASGLVVASDSDIDNLYITLSARTMRPDLLIVARASDSAAAVKLERAGANRVVQPYATAGEEMAKLVLKPQVAAFLEMVSSHGGPELSFEEVEVRRDSGQCGKTIRDLRIRAETGALVVGLRKHDGSFDTTPDPDERLDDGDVLVAMGTPSELQKLEDLFAPHEAVAR